MNRTATIVLFLLAVGLATFVGTTQRWRFSTMRTVHPGSPLFDFETGDINGIRIKNGDQSFRLKRFGDEWSITQGIEDTASKEAVDALFRSALETPVLDRIDSSEIRDDKNLSAYGVLKSSLQIDFHGDKAPSLLVGKTSPDGSRQYVSFENSNTVYLIPAQFIRLITLPVENFRDRRILPIDPATIERVVFHKGNLSLELQREGSGWKIIRPLNCPADDLAVEELLSKINALRLESFELKGKQESTENARLDALAEIQFFTGGDDKAYSIKLAPPSDDAPARVHLDSRKISGKVSSNATALFAPDIESLRDTALLRVNLDLVDIIRVEENGAKRDITRTREGWSDKSENVLEIAKTLAGSRVQARLPATPSELAKCGLETPSKRISFLSVLSENTPEAIAGEYVIAKLSIGSAMQDGRVPILVDGTPEIRLVKGELLNALP